MENLEFINPISRLVTFLFEVRERQPNKANTGAGLTQARRTTALR
jgi:hypothetical protein